jgi:hypothetical protein
VSALSAVAILAAVAIARAAAAVPAMIGAPSLDRAGFLALEFFASYGEGLFFVSDFPAGWLLMDRTDLVGVMALFDMELETRAICANAADGFFESAC